MPKEKKLTAKSDTPTNKKVPGTFPKTSGDEWWSAGIQFECTGSGKCCVSHGQYGFVWMTVEDRKRMAGVLKLSLSAFTRKHCEKQDGLYRLRDGSKQECEFLINKRCSVYEGRPTQCRTWPFWPEVMSAKSWKKDVAAFCPGVGRGRVIPADEIRTQLEQQTKSEAKLVLGK